jgi:pimeloyl-ACP methyl ester carboxylesterase
MKKILLFGLLLALLAQVAWGQGFRFEQLDYGRKTQSLRLNDSVQIAYQEAGKGRQTLLLIHGLGSYLPAWQENLEVLSKKYHCIALDLPGYGKSSKHRFVSLDFYADMLKAFIEKKGLRRVVLVGHSMGGQIALTFALKHPALAEKLVLVAPAGIETFSEQEAQMLKQFTTAAAIAATPDALIEQNLKKNFVNFPQKAAFMATDRIKMKEAPDFGLYCAAVSASVKAMLQEPVAQHLEKIQMPVLIIFGEEDGLIPNKILHPQLSTAQIAEEAQKKMAGSQVVLIPSAGHFVQFEQAEKVNQAILQWLGAGK